MRRIINNEKLQQGFSLLEVMIALVVFTIGMLGMVALTATATKIGNAAFLHTQALILAEDMANRMSSNPVGLFADDPEKYNGYATPSDATCFNKVCNGFKAAEADMAQWGTKLAAALPSGTGHVICKERIGGGGVVDNPDSNIAKNPKGFVPIADGLCWIRITWDEPSAIDESGFVSRTLDYGFQP